MVESLHQCDQGVFGHMIEQLRGDIGVNTKLMIKDRMNTVSKDYWIGSLHLPDADRFWLDNINIQGHENRAVMQVRFFLMLLYFVG